MAPQNRRKRPSNGEADGKRASKKVRWNKKPPPSEEDSEEEQVDELQSSQSEKSEAEEPVDDRQLCVTATCLGGRIGAAFYSPADQTMYLVEDTTESTHYDLGKMLLEQTKPDLVLVPSRADEDFITFCRESMEETGGTFQVRPHKEFVPIKGRDKMLTLSLFNSLPVSGSSMDDDGASTAASNSRSSNAYQFMQRRRYEGGDPTVQRQHALIRMANYSQSENPLCLSAVGALLDHLVRMQALSGDLESEGIASLDIQNIEILALSQAMQLNADALSSLQIFDEESHASIHSSKSKEGLSLFGILDFTKTSFGRSLLRQWCLRPSLHIPEIRGRHAAIACFMRDENIPIAEAMHSHIGGLKNSSRAFGRIKAGKSTTNEWTVVVKFAYHASLLMENVSDLTHTHDLPVLDKLHSTVNPARLKELGAIISSTIDFETSEHERRTCVRPHVDPELDKQKQIYHGLDHLLSKVALEVKKAVPVGWAEELNVLYFPQLGYLICVPLKEEWTTLEDLEAVDGWTYQFSSDVSAYYKDEHMLDLDEHIGDLYTVIADREIEIIHGLEQEIMQFEPDILLSCDACAELDCLLSFAYASRVYDYCQPRMVEENVIHIKAGRHPLVERLADIFVPNDTYVVGGRGGSVSDDDAGPQTSSQSSAQDEMGETEPKSVVVLTGANGCGKSVYLKQTALICFMAQIGCFVPAESATLGVVDKIFTRLQTRESVAKVQSSFMIDLNQVSLALRNATARSLILLDEFGNGTIPTDGAAIFCSVIKHLLDLQSSSNGSSSTPKVFAATHFHKVFKQGLLDSSLKIAYMHMEAMLTKTSGELVEMGDASKEVANSEDEESAERVEIHYLYRVAHGLSLNSHATKCALMYGIPQSVVNRAEHVSDLVSHHDLGQLLDEEITEAEKAELEEAEAVCRAFIAWDFNEDKTEVKARLAEVLGVEEE